MKRIFWPPMILVFLLTGGCATIQGMGEDIQNLGRGIRRTLSERGSDSDTRSG